MNNNSRRLMHFTKQGSLAFAAILSVATLAGCDNNSEVEPLPVAKTIEPSACFWVGPYNIDHPDRNFAYPDTGANYWHAGYVLPEGASLKLHGQYPYARDISLNTYRADTSPAMALTDQDIAADSGSFNPFLEAADRLQYPRDFTISMRNGSPVTDVANNTLFDFAESGSKSTLIYRVYVADEGKDIQGGVTLPAVELTLSSGEQLFGQQACDVLQVDTDELAIPLVPMETYAKIRSNPAFSPAKQPAIWRAAYNGQFGIQCAFLGQCDGTPQRQVSYYANADNQYISTFLDSNFGEIAVTRGKLPVVPKTLAGAAIFDTSEAQMRYWSICQNEYYSQVVTACLFDENIFVDDDGYYTVVTSPKGSRPNNAVDECEVNYLPWTEQGDGFKRVTLLGENKLNEALLIVRNMLPKAGFNQAVQNTLTPGDEYAVMAEYLPVTEYMSQADFEALGCGGK